MSRIGFALAAAGALLWVATGIASPYPSSAFGLEADVREKGTLDASSVRLAIADGYAHSYDAPNDTTLLFVEFCSHALCTPLVPVRGDLRGGLDGPLLLAPVGADLRLVPAPPIDPEIERRVLGVREVDVAYSTPFEPASPWPPFAARSLALALVAAGVAIAATRRRSGAAAASGALVGVVVAQAPSYVILAQLVGIPLLLVTAAVALVQGMRARRAGFATTLALLAALAVGAAFVAFTHFPPSGVGD